MSFHKPYLLNLKRAYVSRFNRPDSLSVEILLECKTHCLNL
jgi:hypothetical protein